jgi:hypothetical protein
VTPGVAPRSIELGRLAPLVGVVLLVVGALVVLNVVALLLFGAHPQRLSAAEVLDPIEYRRIGAQVAAAEMDWGAGTQPGPHRLAIVVGLSTAREDIDSRVLGAGLCPAGMTVLNLGNSGGSYRELAFYLRALRSTSLQSSLTIVAVHPVWLAGRAQASASASGASSPRNASIVSSGGPLEGLLGGLLAREVQRFGWIVSNRRGLHASLVDELLRVRAAIADRFGFGASALFAGDSASPWSPRYAYHERHAGEEFLNDQLVAWARYGWFNARSFSSTGPEAASLDELLRELRSLGSPMAIVLMPERSEMRRLIPAVADRAFRVAVGRGNSAAIVDLRDQVPDSMFYDYAHLNAGGRARVSTEMAARLSEVARCR